MTWAKSGSNTQTNCEPGVVNKITWFKVMEKCREMVLARDGDALKVRLACFRFYLTVGQKLKPILECGSNNTA